MNFQFYVEKLKASDSYKEFIEKNPEAFVCSGFFIIDKEGNDNQQHFDYWIPKDKSMVSFKLEANCEIAPIQMIDDKVPEQISLDLDFDFKEIERLIEDKKEQEGLRKKIQKYLFSLQKKDNKHYLIGTVFISMLGMLKVQIDLEKKEIVEFEKKSFFDIMKVKRGKKG
jgi:hypothetical protein